MATDATGTPTSLGIPTFNVDVDAPSGLGSNAQMSSIDTLIANRVLKPAGVAAGDVPVWNGSTWVVPSGTRTGTKFLRDDGSWASISGGTGGELYYAENTTSTAISGTTEGTATSVFAGASTAYDGTAILLEVWFPFQTINDTSNTITVVFFDGATSVGQFRTTIEVVAASGVGPIYGKRKIAAPSAGNHTYNVKAFSSGTSPVLGAGTGAAGTFLPAFFRVTKA